MDLLTKELTSTASVELSAHNTVIFFTYILPEQLNLEGQVEVVISELSYSSMYQTFADGNFLFYETKFSKSSDKY